MYFFGKSCTSPKSILGVKPKPVEGSKISFNQTIAGGGQTNQLLAKLPNLTLKIRKKCVKYEFNNMKRAAPSSLNLSRGGIAENLFVFPELHTAG